MCLCVDCDLWFLLENIFLHKNNDFIKKNIYLGQPYCLQASAFGVGIYHSFRQQTADLTVLDSQ
jgi:hypothetical protein